MWSSGRGAGIKATFKAILKSKKLKIINSLLNVSIYYTYIRYLRTTGNWRLLFKNYSKISVDKFENLNKV